MAEFVADHAVWLLPVLIFGSRVVDVSIGTLRIIFLSRGMRILAPLCGFFEVLVWLLAIGQIMQNLDSWLSYFAYAGGFTAGNYVGMLIESRLAMGLQSLWVITKEDATKLVDSLRAHSYGITRVAARGLTGKVRVLILVVQRKKLDNVLRLVRAHNPEAFITVQDVRNVSGGYFSMPEAHGPLLFHRRWETRKAK